MTSVKDWTNGGGDSLSVSMDKMESRERGKKMGVTKGKWRYVSAYTATSSSSSSCPWTALRGRCRWTKTLLLLLLFGNGVHVSPFLGRRPSAYIESSALRYSDVFGRSSRQQHKLELLCFVFGFLFPSPCPSSPFLPPLPPSVVMGLLLSMPKSIFHLYRIV